LNLSFESWAYILSSALAIFGTLLVLTFPFIIVYLIRKNNIKNKKFVKRFGGIYAVYREDSN